MRRIVLIIVVICAAWFVLAVHAQYEARAFFSQQLASIRGSETVSVRGKTYSIQNGAILKPGSSPEDLSNALPALRVAYAQELARRAPLLGLAGTDPETLSANIDSLQSAVNELASWQASTSSAELLQALYPLAFLSRLATLEEYRQAFLASGSDVNEEKYEAALDDAIQAGTGDSESFQRAYDAATAGSAGGDISTFGGTITVDSASSSIEAIRSRFDELQILYDKQTACLRGVISECDARELQIAVPATIPPIGNGTTDNAAAIVRSVTLAAFSPSYAFGHDEVVLASSTCAGMLPPPYYVLAASSENATDVSPIRFLNDLFFTPTAQVNGPVPAYMREVHGISLAISNPMEFYQCPQLGSDLGEIRAITATADFAQAHPSIAVAQRDRFLAQSGVLREDDALQYLQAALAQTENQDPSGAYADMIPILLMFDERSAGLDTLVGMIASIDDTDAHMKMNGVPFDVTSSTLFLTHSAFPSLFLSQNPAAGDSPVVLTESNTNNFEKLLSNYVTYFSIRASVPEQTIVQNMRAFYAFENNAK